MSRTHIINGFKSFAKHPKRSEASQVFCGYAAAKAHRDPLYGFHNPKEARKQPPLNPKPKESKELRAVKRAALFNSFGSSK